MDPVTECPRGHPLAEDAVYCTVCWIRVQPEDPEVVSARTKRRRWLFMGIPLLGGSAIIVGIAVGGALGTSTGNSGASVVALPPTVTASAPAPSAPSTPITSSTAAAEPVSVVAAPLAATVADPVKTPADAACIAIVRDQEVACVTSDDRLEFTVCVPDATTLIRVGTRPNDNVVFSDASSEIELGGPSDCPAGEIAAAIAIDSFSPLPTWRIVGRDKADLKIWKSRVVLMPNAR
jgi:hypothetical protein